MDAAKLVLRVQLLRPNATQPKYMTKGAAGLDLHACLGTRRYRIDPQSRWVCPTGIAIAIPSGYEGQIRPRSGLAKNHGITVLNTPATIDSDYRGEIGIILVNLGNESFEVKHGDRIAQLLVVPVPQVRIEVVDALDGTARGNQGFGSTGVNQEEIG
jgi:dUTP pyrophosphatase